MSVLFEDETEKTPWPTDPFGRVVDYSLQRKVLNWPTIDEKEHLASRDIAEKILFSMVLLDAVIVIDPKIRGGTPVLVGTRVPIARLFSEVATGRTIDEISDDKELRIDDVRQVFSGFAAYLGRSFTK